MFKELKLKHHTGALIHNELTKLINDSDIEVRVNAHKLAKELGYGIAHDNWNTNKVYPTKALIKTLSKLI